MTHYITKKNYDDLIAEIYYLNTIIIPEDVEDKRLAAEKGDLSENAEYTAAIENLNKHTARRDDLVALKTNLQMITDSPPNDGKVHYYSKFVLFDEITNEESEYQIVDDYEKLEQKADNKEDDSKLSPSSPLALKVLGKEIGDTITFVTNNGKVRHFGIVDIYN